jgi:hypothetical protein
MNLRAVLSFSLGATWILGVSAVNDVQCASVSPEIGSVQDKIELTTECGPKWDPFAAYIHKMMDLVQAQWARILVDSRTRLPSGTYVTVKFTMDLHGRVTEITDVANNSSDPGTRSCLTAVSATAPYGEWTNDMVASLGKSQEILFKFHYK